jgi:formylglycine-generating enzyme required for sulfatase activity
MGKYPVTQAQYEALMGNNPSGFKGQNNPVESVSWNDAKEFCQKLSQLTGKSYQLPSESQWEYACRAESPLAPLNKGGSKYCFGDNESQLKDYAWYRDNSSSQTHPVGQKKPNNWGLYDMHGNVWEWCEDDWVDNYNNTPRDGTAHKEKSMSSIGVRGGYWNDFAYYCRSANRKVTSREYRFSHYGFRLILAV